MPDSTPLRHHRRLILHRALVCVYWLAIFAATHAPLSEPIDALPGTDKHLHFAAYFVLAGLLMLWHGAESAAARGRAAKVVLILAVYAAADELTQPFVDRDADLLDWVADLGGTVAGVAVALWLTRRLGRHRDD